MQLRSVLTILAARVHATLGLSRCVLSGIRFGKAFWNGGVEGLWHPSPMHTTGEVRKWARGKLCSRHRPARQKIVRKDGGCTSPKTLACLEPWSCVILIQRI